MMPCNDTGPIIDMSRGGHINVCRVDVIVIRHRYELLYLEGDTI